MRSVQVVEVFGMPDREEACNKVGWESIVATNVHIRTAENRYFIARVTDFAPVGCETLRKLDPDVEADMLKIAELMPTIAKAMGESDQDPD